MSSRSNSLESTLSLCHAIVEDRSTRYYRGGRRKRRGLSCQPGRARRAYGTVWLELLGMLASTGNARIAAVSGKAGLMEPFVRVRRGGNGGANARPFCLTEQGEHTFENVARVT